MLNVYLVSRTDETDWDEYDSNYYPFCRDKVEIIKIDLNGDTAKPILGSYNAG